MARFALSPEPPARALSSLAYDEQHKKLVLFGGDRMDSALSDTWVYDCKARSWEQRFPKKVPPARGGHILGWLPETKKVVLAGGYSRRGRLAHEIWTYDVARNEWALLMRVPMKRSRRKWHTPGCPMASSRGFPLAGAVGPGDVILAQQPDANTTYTCRIDASKPDVEGTAKYGVEPGTLAFHYQDPGRWEKVAAPDRARVKAFLDSLPANKWMEFKSPQYAPGAGNRWGTTAYDPERKQFLFWGGGHATSKDNEVSHFSVRGGCWTTSYPPDYPLNPSSYMTWGGRTFAGRPAMPWAHAYQAYEYSPGGKMCLLNQVYDVRAREWMPARAKGLKCKGLMKSLVEYTPHGAVCLSQYGLFKFDAKSNQWSALPWKGPRFGTAWCDGHALCYDYKRDCLWAAHGDIFRYDFKTGVAEKVPGTRPKVLGKFALWREQVHLPDADLVLIIRPFKGPGGKLSHIAWDPQTAKYHWVKLPYSDGKLHKHSWSSAVAYDPHLKLVLLNHSRERKVWVLKLDRKTLEMEAIGTGAPTALKPGKKSR
jgi:hypothetical protein